MMDHDTWLEEPYQEQEEWYVGFDTYCKERYEEEFADKDDAEWPDYREWLDENYWKLEKEWKNEN